MMIGLGIGLISSRGGVVLPAAYTEYWPALTPVGYGGADMGYTGQKWLQVYSIDGTPITTNPYGSSSGGATIPAATPAAPFRVNRENRLVITGDVTPTITAPPTLNASYTIVIREYPTENDAISRTNATGLEQTLTVVCSGMWTLAADSGVDSLGKSWTITEHPAFDLATAVACHEFPMGGVTPGTTTVAYWDPVRYPSGYTTTNETLLLGQASSCQMKRLLTNGYIQRGRTIVIRPGNYNKPVVETGFSGTVDRGTSGSNTAPINISGAVGGTAFSGTAPLYNDGNFAVIVMEKPSRTAMGKYSWDMSTVRYTHCYWRTHRPTLNRSDHSNALSASSSSAHGAWWCQDINANTIRHDNSVFDPVIQSATAPYDGGTVRSSTNTADGIYFGGGVGSPVWQTIIIVGNHFTGGYAGVHMSIGALSGTRYCNGFLFRDNVMYEGFVEDHIKLDSTYNMDIQDNTIFKTPGSGHFDFMQFTASSTATVISVAGGVIKGNAMYSLDDDEGGQGIIFTNVGSATWDALEISNNFYYGGYQNAFALAGLTNPVIRNNVAMCNETRAGEQARIGALGTVTGATVAGNVQAYAGQVVVGGVTDTTSVGTLRRTGGPPNYASAFNNAPSLGTNLTTRAAIMDAWKAKTAGELNTPNNVGWLKPDGTYN